MKHKAIAIIPARGGSKRVHRKNLVDLGGKPLLAHTVLCAKLSKYLVDNIYVSTEDISISKVALDFGAKVIQRPIVLASDKSTTLSVLQHAVKTLEKNGLDFDTIVLLQPTTPFRKNSTINDGINKLWDNWEDLDAVFTVKQSKFPPSWHLRINEDILEFVLPNDFSKIRAQDLDKVYEIDGVVYVLKKDLVKKAKNYPFAKGRTGYIVTNKSESIDIDDEEDLKIARAIYKFTF